VWRKSLLFYAMKRVLQYLCGGGAKSMAHVAACSGAVEAKTSVESYLWRCCMVYGERRRPWRRCSDAPQGGGGLGHVSAGGALAMEMSLGMAIVVAHDQTFGRPSMLRGWSS
jgi:hypothetical protein